MSGMFKDEVIYITGATAGIGLATAKLCMEQGATVVITGRDKDRLEKAESELKKISLNVIAQNVDVSDELVIPDSLNEIYKMCGKIDGLVNLKVEKMINLVFFCWPPMPLKTKPQPPG